jgi:hypothetical protein
VIKFIKGVLFFIIMVVANGFCMYLMVGESLGLNFRECIEISYVFIVLVGSTLTLNSYFKDLNKD